MFMSCASSIYSISVRSITRKMIGQAKISSFFKAGSSTKRPSIVDKDDDKVKEAPEPKKPKVQAKFQPDVKHKPSYSKPALEPQPSTSTGGYTMSGKQHSQGGSPEREVPAATKLPSIPDKIPQKDDLPSGTPPESAAAVPNTPEGASVALSPEQKVKIADNQLKAKLKLTTTNTQGLVRDFGLTWFKALQDEFAKPYFRQLAKFVAEERKKATVFPPPHQVFTFTQACEIKEVKVVIIGQDPYHGTGQAHGLSFSVQKGIKPPPSLVNMFKELEEDVDGFKHPGHGDLTGWAEQGVLMLNACLTVRAHMANSHQGKGWEKFTDSIIAWLNRNRAGLVFILWGTYAQKKGAQIDKRKHLVLKGVHPSPLSAHRGYFGCKHFSQCNKYLKEHHKTPIDWKLLPNC